MDTQSFNNSPYINGFNLNSDRVPEEEFDDVIREVRTKTPSKPPRLIRSKEAFKPSLSRLQGGSKCYIQPEAVRY